MQTFLPYKDFQASLSCLDYRRLGKQRVEAKQILNALATNSGGWRNHPATLMWKGYEEALKLYHNIAIKCWVDRGYNNNMPFFIVDENKMIYPKWLGDIDFHRSHQSNLLRKNPEYYGKLFLGIPNNLPYIWPSSSL